MLVLGHALALGVPSHHAPAALAGRELGTAVLTARASGWTLDPRVYEEPGQFTGCPDGQRNAAESECLAAVQEAMHATGETLEHHDLKKVDAGADGWVPSGCSYSRGHGQRAIFNRNPAGRNWGSYPLVCIEGEVQPPEAALPYLGLNQSYPEQFNPVYVQAFGPALVGWAAQAMQEISQQFMCNVSRLPSENVNHPAFRGHLTNLMLPAGAHLLLFGSSHIASVREVLLSVARYLGRSVTTDYVSRADYCGPKDGLGFSGSKSGICGMHLETACEAASLTVDAYEPCDGCGVATMTTIQNHPQYQVAEHTEGYESNLDALLRDAQPPFTHGYYSSPHDPAYFDAHCEFERGGPMPDPSKVGDTVEAPCDPAVPSCHPAMLWTILKYLPGVGVRGGLSLHRNKGNNNSTLVRIAKSYEADLLPKPDGHPGLSAHACNVICQPGVACLPGEGLGIAWEVLRSASLQECDSSCPCDSVDGWHLWSDRMMAGDGFDELASEMSVISERAAAARAAAAEKLAAAKAAEEERRLTAAAAAEKAAAEELGIPY